MSNDITPLEKRLTEKGELDKLFKWTSEMLTKEGWRDDMTSLCLQYINDKKFENISGPQELIENLRTHGRPKVPTTVKSELLERIWELARKKDE